MEEDAGREYYSEDKEEHLTEDAARFLVVRDCSAGADNKIVGFAHFRFTLHGELADGMEGEVGLLVHAQGLDLYVCMCICSVRPIEQLCICVVRSLSSLFSLTFPSTLAFTFSFSFFCLFLLSVFTALLVRVRRSRFAGNSAQRRGEAPDHHAGINRSEGATPRSFYKSFFVGMHLATFCSLIFLL